MTPNQSEVRDIASCYHPLKAFPVGYTENNKVKYKICSYDVDRVKILQDGQIIPEKGETFFQPFVSNVVEEYVQIPCGKCTGCRLQYSRMWADRCMLETQYHKSNYFLTLTYDDKHLYNEEYKKVDDPGGKYYATIRKRDVQLFIKRLRKAIKARDSAADIGSVSNFCYFVSGEYGDETFRPHYHMIAFDLDIPDLKFWRRTELKHCYYKSKWLTGIWENGEVIIGNVDWNSVAYTARYVMKKQYGDSSEFTIAGVQPPFSMMSLKPAIGKRYFDEHKDSIFEYQQLWIPTKDGAKEVRPPRYFIKLLERESPDLVREMMIRRRENSQVMEDLRNESTDLDYLDMLAVEEFNKIEKTKILKRRGV